MSSTDETSALKRNSVHQTRLSLELQQLEKDRMIRLREMQKASQAFARRQEQIQGIREKASLRRVPSAPVHNLSRNNSAQLNKTLLGADSNEDSTLQPFVTKGVRLESAPASNSRRTLHKTLTMPSLDLLPSRVSSSHSASPFPTNPAQKGTSPRRVGFTPPLEEKPNSSRVPMYSRNFCAGVRQRDDLVKGMPVRKSSLPGQSTFCVKNSRSKSLAS